MRKSLRLFAVLTLSCLASWGCGLSIGPQTKTRYVLIEEGRPVEILENRKVQARQLGDDGDTVEQDVGGWIAMPRPHWDAVKRALDKNGGDDPAGAGGP